MHISISTLCPRNESPKFLKSGRCVGKRFRKKLLLANALTPNASGWPEVTILEKQATGGTKLRGGPACKAQGPPQSTRGPRRHQRGSAASAIASVGSGWPLPTEPSTFRREIGHHF